MHADHDGRTLWLPAGPCQLGRCSAASTRMPLCQSHACALAPCSRPWACSTRPGLTPLQGPGRKLLLRLPKRHEIRSPAVLLTGKEAEFNQAGLFSTDECALCSSPGLTAQWQGGAL